MSKTTLSTLICKANAAELADIDAAWTLKQIGKALPNDSEILKAPAEVIAEPIPEFRPKKAGGLIKIGDHIVGQAAHLAFLDGRKGKWTEMKADIFATLAGGAPLSDIATKKSAAPNVKKENKKEAKPEKKTVKEDVADEDFLICEECGRKVSYEDGLVRLGGKRICGRCAKKHHAHVNVPCPNAVD